MASPIAVEPDMDFIREIKTQGGDSLKKCFQCASCATFPPKIGPSPEKR